MLFKNYLILRKGKIYDHPFLALEIMNLLRIAIKRDNNSIYIIIFTASQPVCLDTRIDVSRK